METYSMGVGLVVAVRAATPEAAAEAVKRASERFREGLSSGIQEEGAELLEFRLAVRDAHRVIPEPDPDIWEDALGKLS